VKSGERIPSDGTITDGETPADESLLTGEFAPVAKKSGSTVVVGHATDRRPNPCRPVCR